MSSPTVSVVIATWPLNKAENRAQWAVDVTPVVLVYGMPEGHERMMGAKARFQETGYHVEIHSRTVLT